MCWGRSCSLKMRLMNSCGERLRETNAMTALINQQLELAAVHTISDSIRQAKLRETNAERIGKLARNYQEYTAELRRRYSLES